MVIGQLKWSYWPSLSHMGFSVTLFSKFPPKGWYKYINGRLLHHLENPFMWLYIHIFEFWFWKVTFLKLSYKCSYTGVSYIIGRTILGWYFCIQVFYMFIQIQYIVRTYGMVDNWYYSMKDQTIVLSRLQIWIETLWNYSTTDRWLVISNLTRAFSAT